MSPSWMAGSVPASTGSVSGSAAVSDSAESTDFRCAEPLLFADRDERRRADCAPEVRLDDVVAVLSMRRHIASDVPQGRDSAPRKAWG